MNNNLNVSLKTTDFLLRIGKEDASKVIEEFQSSLLGLTFKEAKARLEKYGRNEVDYEKPPAWWMQMIYSFNNAFVFVLIVLGIVSFFTDIVFVDPTERDWTKVVIIFTMVFLSSLLRFWQEFQSQKAVSKLQKMVKNRALVIRQFWEDDEDAIKVQDDDNKREILISHIVPGDIVYLSAGDMIPADIRLISSKDLFVSQSVLTGESMPVEKYANLSEVSESFEEQKEISNPLELGTLCFMGTNVISGSAVGIVVATGNKTYFGSIAKNLAKRRELTSFDIGINRVSLILVRFIVVMVLIVFIINGFTKNNWLQAFLFAISIAVGLTPEMLPMVVATNLAKGAIKMSKKKVIVKRLNAIQNLGAMDVLCTDKTGTLTENRIVLSRYFDSEGRESERILSLAYINSYFQTGLKNLMDIAIIERMEREYDYQDERSCRKIDEIPFDFTRRRMSVVVEKDNQHILICKGAVSEILKQCTMIEKNGQILLMSDEDRARVKDFTVRLNKDGLRVIAVSYKNVPKRKKFYSIKDEDNLIFVGYIAFFDPPKESAKEALLKIAHRGIKIKIITGDNEIVAEKICKEVNLKVEKILLGSDIDSMSDDELALAAEDTTIFARVNPLQKSRIIKALKSNNHTVGYLGDGINDAAALYEADVGISVDNGVDIAKETADIIILENDLLLIEKGVVEGRIVFGNIMKYIKMAVSSNFGNVLSVLVASIFLPFLPMLPVQLLIQNLLYDLSQTSLPWDTMDKDFLQKPRKWDATDITRFMIYIGPTSSIFDIITFIIMWFVFKANSPAVQSLFQSGWFVEGLVTQTLIIHIIRTQKIPFIQSRASAPVFILTIGVMIVGIILPFTKLGLHVGLQPLPLAYFAWLFLILLSYCILKQFMKVWYISRFGKWL